MKPLADERTRLPAMLSRVLTVCTAAAGLVCMTGILAMIARGNGASVEMAEYAPVAKVLRAPVSIMQSALAGDALAIMQCAVVVLIATPVLRVLAALVVFAVERDWLYVLLSVLVLGGLALGFAGIVG